MNTTKVAEGHTNRLIHEKSPYLLQHAHNPVDWYPWGEEAFTAASERDVPIFLSIGYSTCHWCHVMAHESFEDEEVAAALNEAFVCIKVDREERPDLDAYYMSVCQALTGSGGWPLTVLMTPDRQAFYAGTYFPKSSRYGRPGLIELVAAITKAWQGKRESLMQTATEVREHLEQADSATPDAAALTLGTLDLAYRQLAKSFDAQHGGFGRAPKFPTPHNLTFLLRYWRRTGLDEPLQMVLQTLRQMGAGGVYDQVGFGFHRYSTDRVWLVPHFEKMLYDQALLAIAFLEAYQATGEADLAEKAREIFTYVLRDMTDAKGGFYSAEDADSEGEEGKFYVWSLPELQELLSGDELSLVRTVFDVTKQGNFRDEASGKEQATNILHLNKTWVESAQELQLSEATLQEKWRMIREKLLSVREQRVRPHLDDKVLADWNGLMIATLALGGRVLQEDRWTDAARRAAKFLLGHLRRTDGRLWKRYREGEAALVAHLDDYAFTTWGLLELYETSLEPAFLRLALEINQIMLDLFLDQERGGFYLTAADQTEMPLRMKETYDSAIPAGNSVATQNNLRLSRLTGDEHLAEVARQSLVAIGSQLAAYPTAHTQMLQALDFYLGPSFEVVVVGQSEHPDMQAMLKALSGWYQPRQVLLLRPAGEAEAEIVKLAPYLADYQTVNDQATAYVCSGFSCQRPTTEVGVMLKQLGKPDKLHCM